MLKTIQRAISHVVGYRFHYAFLVLLVTGLVSCQQSSGHVHVEEQVPVDESAEPPVEVVETEYVCPMRCDGSGKDDPGTCNVCKMLLVRSVEVEDFDPENSKYAQGSVYNLEANWLTQSGESVELADLSDNYQLVCMIFTACPEACPNLVGDMANIDAALEPEVKENVNYLLVTIDPDRDDPERLTNFAGVHNLDTSRWTLLQGEKDKILELSNMLGVEYKQYENGSFGHTNYLTLLNRKGEIIYRLHGIHMPNEEMLDFMHKHI